ncbi:hypothetical protein QBC47DRAFT_403987 [Echria macrotheca]|uniref:Trichothecene 3-O-acetyltransferase-like N-terminal domain-containing protein n=1 Tax=Echria macrotheca TaxID=438768 RepID=A0AAJ0F9Y6_9PEZI|nr:hypothetical protein QBC47DRAFT_403987 [Echria macrotheca]
MPRSQVFNLHPAGWETDPPSETFPLSTLDYCIGQVYTNYALFFALPDDANSTAVRTLHRGLEITLSNSHNRFFRKSRDSTVALHVQWLDGPDDNFPTLENLRDQHFASRALGDLETWCVPPMTYGENPAAQPTSLPIAAVFKLLLIRGGMVFKMHHHHYADDVMGWAGMLHQLAEICAAVWRNCESPSLPAWDLQGCLLDIKATELKGLASPRDGSYWISTYDAVMAYIWPILTKHRASLFRPDPKQTLLWGEAVDMRRRLDPPVPERMQGNVVYVAIGTQSAVTPLTVEEVISTAPLEKLAWYIRQLTNSVASDSLAAALAAIAPIRDKTSLFLRTDSFPSLSNFVTDWRDTRPCEADFGFGRPCAMRFSFDTVTAGLTVVYLPRNGGDKDEGNEFSIGFEKELVEGLLADPDWTRYFEFRGIDAEDAMRQ